MKTKRTEVTWEVHLVVVKNTTEWTDIVKPDYKGSFPKTKLRTDGSTFVELNGFKTPEEAKAKLKELLGEKEYFYYEVHVVQSIHDGFGVPVKSDKKLTDEEAIQLAMDDGRVTEDDVVDYVEPLTKEEYEE
jgi:ketosteroid isomerase-like protein